MKATAITKFFRTFARVDVIGQNSDPAEFVADQGLEQGQGVVFTPGGSAEPSTTGDETGGLTDPAETVKSLALRILRCNLDAGWKNGDDRSNGPAVRPGPSLTVSIVDGLTAPAPRLRAASIDCNNSPRKQRAFLRRMGQ